MVIKERYFLARVRQAMPDFHPAERRLGEFVCDFPGELASYSGSELANLAHVSKATVSRFVKRLGYSSYEEARRDARAEKLTGSRLFLSTAADGGAVKSVAAHVAQSVANLQESFASISDTQIDAVAQAMLSARKVWVIGFRSSHAFANYLQWQLTQVIENIVAIPSTSAPTVADRLRTSKSCEGASSRSATQPAPTNPSEKTTNTASGTTTVEAASGEMPASPSPGPSVREVR
jgi:DNA-binding MurR/RpiR family transcriptional regulator